ncbi:MULTISPECIES: tRNA pseudouridine(38-40) synthase TruA [unclassified Bacillus (in: firmicutes)]|uniref:tRNA pseudouridine(38-40) synthase TruA n=1 Tax=unclassified Bacillus (in: firmicutes) TaxID=185979 RepID=UPI0008F140D9|nr:MULTISPECIES: tRNA pseudouridine(38-40) synthase TruA [unclassified Bacillus (in: firmicutes)]SFB26895.1 tRNA pseudouridine38-40 synthase [Bacillus sp. UNCCL13]SFQ92076.1 tRNA pseudouridine38-40 synthase [Bacillus sp. cl95]
MQRYKCIISYDGTAFAGYQVQPEKRTVQGELETILTRMHKYSVKIFASGRTDAGVHAKGQVIHFDSDLKIPLEKWIVALNAQIPDDIVIQSIELAKKGFHSRFDTSGKQYRYFLELTDKRNPFTRNHAFHFPYQIDLVKMKTAAKFLIGEHDFTSFCAAGTDVKDKVRIIEDIDFVYEGNQLCIRFVGNGFLYNMVRILVGTLIEVGTGKRAPESLKEVLEGKDRSLAGKTAPAHGLYLWEVYY